MSAEVSYRILFESGALEIRDYRCCRRDPALSPEQYAPFDAVVFPRQGVWVKHVGGHEVIADPNQAVFFDRDEVYRLSHPYGCGDRDTEFGLAPGVLDEIRRAHGDDAARGFAVTHVALESRAYLLQRLMFRLADSGGADGMEIEELALALIGLLYRAGAARSCGDDGAGPRRRSTRQDHRQLADAVVLVLAGRFDEPWTLERLAIEVASSPYHLCRVFRRHTGATVHRYLSDLRLRASLERVAECDADLTAVALDLGFSSHSHFSSAFRRTFGMTPSAVRAGATRARLGELSRNLSAAL